MAAADIDGDGLDDLLASTGGFRQVVLLTNFGAPDFAATAMITDASIPQSASVADFDGDQELEIALGCFHGQVVVYDLDVSNSTSDTNGNRVLDSCEGPLLRGDCNGDGKVGGEVSDALFLLNYNFNAGQKPSCIAACDANGDGRVGGQVSDAIYLLNYGFLSGRPPRPPFPDCGPLTSAQDLDLGCASPTPGCQ